MTGLPRIDGLTIVLAVLIVAVAVIAAAGLRALFHDRGEHARPFRDSPSVEDPYPAVMAGLRHRYGTIGDDGPPPFMSAPPWAPAAAADAAPHVPPPPVHHDAYRYPQRWHRERVTVTRCHLPSLAGPALGTLAAVLTALGEHLAAQEAALQAEAMSVFPPWRKWPGDATLGHGELTTEALAEYEKTLAAAKDGA